jgi:hypothetical protein
MSRAAPPEKKAGPREWHPNGPGKSVDQRAQGYRQSASSASLYRRLVFHRCAVGLLAPFQCAGCHQIAIDPIGWNGRRQPLCGPCSDLERSPA